MRLRPAPVRTKQTKIKEIIARTGRLSLSICLLILAAISNSFKTRLGVGILGMLRAPNHGVISRTLGFQTQAPKGHPNQGMEPIQDACRPSRQLSGPVIASHVLQFVNQRATEVSIIP